MRKYLEMLKYIQAYGEPHRDRTRVGTRRVFGYQFRHDVGTSFPLLTTKKLPFKSIVAELLWFLRGQTNVKELQALGSTIWDEWADKETGELGRIYGAQWRDFAGCGIEGCCGFDQIKWLIDEARRNPDSRRLIVTAWNPADALAVAAEGVPPACHTLWNVGIMNRRVNLHMFQRSADAFLGVPFNIASYALLIHLIAACTGNLPGDLVISYSDLHIYNNHQEQVTLQLNRWPRGLPSVTLTPAPDYMYPWEISPEDIQLHDYDPQPAIAAPVAV